MLQYIYNYRYLEKEGYTLHESFPGHQMHAVITRNVTAT